MSRSRELDEPEIVIEAPETGLEPAVEARLRDELLACPDVAFGHLPQVTVHGHGSGPRMTLFVWLVPEGIGSLRAALNQVSEAVARALPKDQYLDVLILNSAPELLAPVEAADALLVVRDPEERQRAVEAAACGPTTAKPSEGGRSRWW